MLRPDSCEVSLRSAVLLAPVPPAALQGMNAASAGGQSAAPGSIQDHSGDVHIDSHPLETDSLQSEEKGEERFLRVSQSFSEVLEHCHF